MYVELVYDRRNVSGLPNAEALIRAELTKRIQRTFPDAEVKVKPMQTNAINSNASKQDKSAINRIIEEMFNEADEWLVSD
ncbi:MULTISPECIES: DinI family protein [Musicola]|uniref:DinI family protein n=1 Tax=Musicola paradisiaca (strain Ech703) TaxID=579405 RepID=C6CDD7_MUSP7|nr:MULTISPECIES: DinI family protein [Musicola]ACS87008.1 DinI family protein [Musicola paradisiaca Ech703]